MVSAVGFVVSTSPYPLGFQPKINDDLKIEGEKFEGYLTLSQTVQLNGEKFTVRLYIENDHRPANQILSDQNIKQQMEETIEKMINISVAYNIGRDSKKKKGSVTGITLARDSKSINQHIDYKKNNHDIDLESTLENKQKKFEKIKKPENALQDVSYRAELKTMQKLQAITYIQSKVLKKSLSEPEKGRNRTESQQPPLIDPKTLEEARNKPPETLKVEPGATLGTESNPTADSYFELVEVPDEVPGQEIVLAKNTVQEPAHVVEKKKESSISPDKIIPDDFRAFKATEVCGHLLDRLGVVVEKLDKLPSSLLSNEVRARLEGIASYLKNKIVEIAEKEQELKNAHNTRRMEFLKSHLFFPDTYVPMPSKEELAKMKKYEADSFLAADPILRLRIDNQARLLLKNVEQLDKEISRIGKKS